MPRPRRIILTGFSGTGKSAVAPIIAEQLGWQVIDTDPLIEERAGKRILDIFAHEGEDHFRDLESAAIRRACAEEDAVISTGGGVVLRPENRRLMADGGFVVCLEARPETIYDRLRDRADEEPLDRPLLATADPLGRIRDLKSSRQRLYALCDWAVHTDGMTPEEAAAEVLRAYELVSETKLSELGRLDAMTAPSIEAPVTTLHAIPPGAVAVVRAAGGEYPVFAGWGIISELGTRLSERGLVRQSYVISDETVFHHLGDEVAESLCRAGVPFDSYVVPPGESTKSLETATELYDWLIQRRAERGHVIVAIGGGVVTDLGGYVAATFARGLPLVHVPTSLAGMVDAAIGGKAAVNHPRAKNMIGAFYQPRFVLADVATLRTLPPREFLSGMGEVIKHGFIADGDYLSFLEENADRIMKLEPDAATEAVRGSVAIKAAVVSEDEFETTGRRSILNYGHTLGHAIESATGYTRYLHGEAVAIGMTAAAWMSVRLGLLDAEVAERQGRLLERYRLPARAERVDRDRVRAAIALDKKVQGKAVRWVLLEGIGRPVLRDDVPDDVVESAMDHVLSGGR